uniref:Uncharacterized protein n=1 Tax=Oryza brachyantha TaxID=4533 RepID=J3N1L8_ORYBR
MALRARRTSKYEKALVHLLTDYNLSHYVVSMIKSTPKRRHDIIEEDAKLKMDEIKSFPLSESLDRLYKGKCAEGKHCFTYSNPNHGGLRGKGETPANTPARKRSRMDVLVRKLREVDGVA